MPLSSHGLPREKRYVRREKEQDQSSACELGKVDRYTPEPIQDSHAWLQIESYHPQWRFGVGGLASVVMSFEGSLTVTFVPSKILRADCCWTCYTRSVYAIQVSQQAGVNARHA